MEVPLTFRDPDGYPYQKDGAEVLYAKARGQNCELYFENGDMEIYGYPLNYFHQKVWDINLFRRIDRYLLLRYRTLANQKWLKAILLSGKILEVTRQGNKKVKKLLAKIRQSSPEEK